MEAIPFLLFLTIAGLLIGQLPVRIALIVGPLAVLGVYWWGVESATGALAEGSIRYALSLAVAAWLSVAIVVGMVIRVAMSARRRESAVRRRSTR